MPIKVKIIQKECFGCGIPSKFSNYYEGDDKTPWCDDCFVTEEKLAALQKQMPFCQKKKIKCRVVDSLTLKLAQLKLTDNIPVNLAQCPL